MCSKKKSFSFPGPSVSICEMGKIVLTLQDCHKGEVKMFLKGGREKAVHRRPTWPNRHEEEAKKLTLIENLPRALRWRLAVTCY